jgi:hypothetical protein
MLLVRVKTSGIVFAASSPHEEREIPYKSRAQIKVGGEKCVEKKPVFNLGCATDWECNFEPVL